MGFTTNHPRPTQSVQANTGAELLCSLLVLVALGSFTPLLAEDTSAVEMIQGVSRKAADATRWEGEGRLTSGDATGEIPFRLVLERPADHALPARARLEIRGGTDPLVRLCDGQFQWTYRLMARQYSKLALPEIDACAYPFTEWTTLSDQLHLAAITGTESLKVGQRRIDCTIVRADFAGQDSSSAGSRTLWIDDVTKLIWQYRVERTGGPGGPSVQTYRYLWQYRDGAPLSADLFQLDLSGAPELPQASTELPKNLYRIAGVTAPSVLSKVEPKYTKAARKAKIQGTVILQVEIQLDGTGRDIRVLRPLDPGLDRSAIEAVSQWRFKPGLRDQTPVPVLATVEVNFRLLDRPRP